MNRIKRVRAHLLTIAAALSESNSTYSGSGCQLVIEKNEWASGCVPAVNFVVRLADCGDGTAMRDVTVSFRDEGNKELGRDYFRAPLQPWCTVSGYGNIKTITPSGGYMVFMVASADLCGDMAGLGNLNSNKVPITGELTECF